MAPAPPAATDRSVDPLAQLTDQGWAAMGWRFDRAETDELIAVCHRRRRPRGPGELARWVTDPRWAPLAMSHLGPDVRFLRQQVVTKAPRSAGVVPWHQDRAYGRVAGEFLTFFLALDEITVDNGCLWLLSGSHRRGPAEHRPRGYLLEIAEPAGTEGQCVPLHPGQAVAFSSLTHHRSGANATDGTRPAWMVQFCAADAIDTTTGAPLVGCPLVALDGVWLPQTGSSANPKGADVSSPATRSRKARTL